MSETVTSPAAALCGFDRCRAPLPGPGPRGGRPFEFCPDRTWPGGKTCKQLAAAQEALREALGQPADTPALTDAATALSATADRLLAPARDLLGALETIKTATAAELAAAATRVEEATTAATQERGLRQAAEERAEQAQVEATQAQATAADAEHEAQQFQEAAAEALAEAQDARAARQQAERSLARAEALTEAERQRADTAVRDAQAERQRADDAIRDLAAATERISVLTVERDSTRTALTELRATTGETERHLRGQLTLAHDATETVRSRLAEAENQLRQALSEHHHQITAVREEVASTREQLASAQHQAGQFAAALEAERTRLGELRDLLLDHDVADHDMRTRSIAVLLSTKSTSPPDEPGPITQA